MNWKRVITYPMFRLDEASIAAALATLEPFIEWVDIDETLAANTASLQRS